jgi:hypothetical protein
LGSGFQQAAKYQMDASKTWFETRILPARDNLMVRSLVSLSFHNLSDFGRDARLAGQLRLYHVGGPRVQGIKIGIEVRDIEGEVALACD